jgi:uroporphyrinogen-III synthase
VDEAAAKALHGKRVAVTRALEQSESLVEALRAAGAVPVIVPMVAFGNPDDPGAVDEAIREPGYYDWTLLTSQNAVRALQERAQLLGIELATTVGATRIAVVGPSTAEAVKQLGLPVEYMAVKHRGVELAEELGEKVRGKRIFLPRSDRANVELVEKLKELGAQVRDVIAYKTVRPDESSAAKIQDIMSEGVDAVMFFSPSAVQHLRDMLGEQRFLELAQRAVYAAIGPVTGKALRKANVERVVMAQDTTVHAAVRVLVDYFTATKRPAGAN